MRFPQRAWKSVRRPHSRCRKSCRDQPAAFSPKRSFSAPFFFYAAHLAIRLGPGCPLHFSPRPVQNQHFSTTLQPTPLIAAPVQLSDSLPAVNSVFGWWIGSLFCAWVLFLGIGLAGPLRVCCSSPCGTFTLSRKHARPPFPRGFFEHFFVDVSINCHQPQRFGHEKQMVRSADQKGCSYWDAWTEGEPRRPEYRTQPF